MNSVTPIKYDKKTKKRWGICLIVSGVIIFIYILLLLVDAYLFASKGKNPFPDNPLLMIFISLFFSVSNLAFPIFVISLLLSIDSSVYLRRLGKNHFEVPEDKRVYNKDLAQVPRTEKVENVYSRDGYSIRPHSAGGPTGPAAGIMIDAGKDFVKGFCIFPARPP